MLLVKRNLVIKITNTQLVFTCPKSTTETLEQVPTTPKANTYIYIHIRTYTYITGNPKHTPHIAPAPPLPTSNIQLPAGYLQLKQILKSYQNAISNSNMQYLELFSNTADKLRHSAIT